MESDIYENYTGSNIMKLIIAELFWDELKVSLLLFSVYKEACGMHICLSCF